MRKGLSPPERSKVSAALLARVLRGSYIAAERLLQAPVSTRGVPLPRKAIVHEQDYVVGDKTIRLSVAVGDRQYGSSMVFLEDEPKANGDVEELPLGNGASLVGKTVTVYTVVTDVRGKSDEVSVTWILTGGPKRSVVTRDGAAARNFGSRMFKGVFNFVQTK